MALRAAEGFGPAGERTVRTTRDGLAIMAGLGVSLASATFNHPSYVPQTLHALTATPGTFGFFEAGLEKGAWCARTHHVNERLPQVPSAGCSTRAHTRVPGKAAVETLFEGKANGSGTCVSSRVPAGAYTLEVRRSEGQSAAEQAVFVENGQATEKNIDLTQSVSSGV